MGRIESKTIEFFLRAFTDVLTGGEAAEVFSRLAKLQAAMKSPR
jgi:hypothetical protein